MIDPVDSVLFRKLLETPQQFSFFQAVRLFENYYFATEDYDHKSSWTENYKYSSKIIKFATNLSLRFSVGDIEKLHQIESSGKRFQMYVNFMGLVGPSGVLPVHYTEQLIQKARQKDEGLYQFLEIFNNRTVNLFYYAWAKYRSFIGFESAKIFYSNYRKKNLANDQTPSSAANTPQSQIENVDPSSKLLSNLVGLHKSTLKACPISSILMHYSGHFARQVRSASALQQILCDYFQVNVQILQFYGKWLPLAKNACSMLPDPSHPQGVNNCLGANMIAGMQIWQCQNFFRIKLGPLTNEEMLDFLPYHHTTLNRLIMIVRQFVGVILSFDVQLIIKADAVHNWQLKESPGFQLGWTTWLFQETRMQDMEDIVLQGQ